MEILKILKKILKVFIYRLETGVDEELHLGSIHLRKTNRQNSWRSFAKEPFIDPMDEPNQTHIFFYPSKNSEWGKKLQKSRETFQENPFRTLISTNPLTTNKKKTYSASENFSRKKKKRKETPFLFLCGSSPKKGALGQMERVNVLVYSLLCESKWAGYMREPGWV